MKTFKTLFALIAMLLCNTSLFAYDFKVDGICYDITSSTDNTVKVTYHDYKSYQYNNYTEYSGSVVIPESVIYSDVTYSVTSIGEGAFYGCDDLISVEIPNNVLHIGNKAFYSCSGLTSMEIPDSIISIGDCAFMWCDALAYIVIGNSVTNVGVNAFSECPNLRVVVNKSSLNIIRGVSTYGFVAYHAYRVLSGENINGFYFDVKDGKYNLTGYDGNKTNLVLPTTYKGQEYSIGNSAFNNCSELVSVIIPNNITSIGEYAFNGCSSLTSVTIPNSVTSIGDYAFYKCSLKSLTIGTGVLAIGEEQCQPVKTIWLTNTPPSGYKNLQGKINYVANDQYNGLSNVKIYPYLSSAFDTDGVKYVPVSPAERTCDAIDCSYDSNVVDINIGKTVSFKGVEMKVQNVMPYTVYGQTSVKTLSVSHASDIGDNAFYGCTGITDASISNEGNIGESAFYGCTALETLTLGENVTSIGGSAFGNCSKLLAVTIPNKTNSLGSYSFAGCTLLKQLDLGNGVQSIGEYSFNGCSALPSIDIPASVTSVGNYTFKGCTSLADVVIKDRTTDLSLGSNGSSPLFADCPLDSVYIGGNISYSTSSSYGYSPFYRNTSLRSVVITDKEEDISDNEFYGCTNLKHVSIGSNVKKIGNWAFSGCSNLDYFSFGKSVESIGDEAFSDCVNITHLLSSSVIPPACGNQALDDINKWNCILKIPEGTKLLYQNAEQWKEFFFVDDVLECPKFEVVYMIDDEVIATDSIKYGKSITLKDAPVKEGHTFAGWENAPETMPANDITITGSYRVNTYAVKYIVDGVDYVTDSVAYGSAITLRDKPVKEGHTFLGWSEAPETMPANDITITGEYKVNTYTVMYVVDGEVIESYPVEYGKELVMMPLAPEKEGHTFMGWSELPATMPAEDVTVTGTFKVNTYAVTYVVDGVTVATDSVVYGTAVTLIDELEKEGYSFSWSETPETMPANDITITGEWSINSYLVTFIIDGEVYATDSVEYGAAITLPEVPEKENSTFEWEEAPTTMPASDVTIYGNYVSGIGGITVSGKADVYTLNGMLYKRDVDLNKLNIELPKGVYIINGKKYLVR